MISTKELAILAIKTLDAQQEYFKTRDYRKLQSSKTLEAELRREAQNTIHRCEEMEKLQTEIQFD